MLGFSELRGGCQLVHCGITHTVSRPRSLVQSQALCNLSGTIFGIAHNQSPGCHNFQRVPTYIVNLNKHMLLPTFLNRLLCRGEDTSFSFSNITFVVCVVSCGLIEADYGGSLKHSLGPFLIHEGDQNQTAHAQYRYKAMTS